MTPIKDFFIIAVDAVSLLCSATLLALTFYLLFSKTQRLRETIASRLLSFLVVLAVSFVLLRLL